DHRRAHRGGPLRWSDDTGREGALGPDARLPRRAAGFRHIRRRELPGHRGGQCRASRTSPGCLAACAGPFRSNQQPAPGAVPQAASGPRLRRRLFARGASMTRSQVKLSRAIRRDLEAIDGQSIVVAAAITVTPDKAGTFTRLGLVLADGRFTTSEPAPPPRSIGANAARNLERWDEKCKDLAKETRDISSWAPSWHRSGHHLVTRTIEAWPVEHHPARMNTISVTVLEHFHDAALVRFRVDQPLDRSSPTFE